jgi:hypothetical protein
MENFIEHKICVSFPSTTFVRNIFLSDMYLATYARVTLKMRTETSVSPHTKCAFFQSDFNQNRNVLAKFSDTPDYRISRKSSSTILELLPADRCTDRQTWLS